MKKMLGALLFLAATCNAADWMPRTHAPAQPFSNYVAYNSTSAAYTAGGVLWRSVPGQIIWGTTAEGWVEEFCGRDKYVWTTAYTDLTNGFVWVPGLIKAQITELRTGEVKQFVGCPQGAPYSKAVVSFDDDYLVEEWANIVGTDGHVYGQYYWSSHFTHAPNNLSGCGVGYVDGVVQDEAWWSSLNGWALSSGVRLPFTATGEPQDPMISMTRHNVFGYHTGAAWNLQCVTRIDWND